MKRKEVNNNDIYEDNSKYKKGLMVYIKIYKKYFSISRVNPVTAKLFNLNFPPPEVVSR